MVRQGRFAFVGSFEDARAAHPGVKVEDFGGNLVMPGMTDAHMHLTAFARQGLYIDMQGACSLDEAGRVLRERAARTEPGVWMRAVNYNEMSWPDRQPPTAAWLDALGLEHPIIMSRYCGHSHVANTRALREGGLWDSADPCVIREDGVPTGRLIEGAAGPLIELAAAQAETPQRLTEAMEQAVHAMSAQGITAAHPCDAPGYALGEELFTWQDLQERGRLPIRIVCYHDRLPEFSFRSGIGDGQIRYGGLKLFCDGNLGGRGAALREPYADMPECTGVLNHTDEELYEAMRGAHVRGIQVALHMIGDRAVEQAVRTAERLVAELGQPRLPSRFSHVICCPDDLRRRMKRLGVVADIQPCEVYADRVMAPLRLTPGQLRDTYPFRALQDAGLLLTGSTDAPMEAEDLWFGIWAAVCRCDDDGAPLPYDPAQALTLDEALRLFTVNPWIAVGMGDRLGRIREGYYADFTAVDGDPFRRPTMELRSTTHLATWLEGAKVWER